VFHSCIVSLGMAFAVAAIGAPRPSTDAASWRSEAWLRRGLKRVPGLLVIAADGVEFRPASGSSYRWPYVEIRTFDLTTRKLVLATYENASWRRPGERRYRIGLRQALPPQVAHELAVRVGKPVKNGDPDPAAPALATIPARRRAWPGASNGTLRFRETGIDYLTDAPGDRRSWRWTDIQTLANPDPFHFRVAGFREIYEFELKRPLSRRLFERLWDQVYARDLHISTGSGGGLQ
jgi:hypothetical protein